MSKEQKDDRDDSFEMGFDDSKGYETIRKIVDKIEKKGEEFVILYRNDGRIKSLGHASNEFLVSALVILGKNINDIQIYKKEFLKTNQNE